jgi:hypothetical protein
MLRPLRESIESLPARQRDGLLAAFGEAEGPTPEPSLVAMAALNLLAVHETLGDLAIDSTRNEGLRDTARVFLQTGGSYTATAERLFLHRNTAQYRVRRAEEVRGRPLRDGRLDVELALLACHWLKGAVLKPP